MQRRNLVVALLGVALGLAGCGQALYDPNSALNQPTFPTATPEGQGVPSAAAPSFAGGSSSEAIQPSAAGSEEASLPPSSDAPPIASAEPVPAESSAPAPAPTVDPAFADASLPGVADRWRYIQINREVFGDGVRTYTTTGREQLWWYDPLFGQFIQLGEISGDFPVQATFRLRGQEAQALEVPYQVNQSFGIKLPEAVLTRMRNAGVGEWAETFVYLGSDITQK